MRCRALRVGISLISQLLLTPPPLRPCTYDSHFDSSQEEINYWRSQARDLQDVLRETESNLQDFMESSKDLEAEMEREIASSTKRLNEMAVKNEALRGDCDEWKVSVAVHQP